MKTVPSSPGPAPGSAEAVAERMLAAGWHVGLVARRADLLHELADPYDGRAVVLPLDVTDADAVQVAFHDFAEAAAGSIACSTTPASSRRRRRSTRSRWRIGAARST
jgi:NAD(P)-dependent dehydrogenase (short-subunit alcohol dehydrogenase family)